MGVHISKVKSVNLDSWTPQQVAVGLKTFNIWLKMFFFQSMQQMQNSKARAVYEAGIPEDFRRPQTDSAVEAFVRQKYEKKKFIQPNWQPSKPPDFPVFQTNSFTQNLMFFSRLGLSRATNQPSI